MIIEYKEQLTKSKLKREEFINWLNEEGQQGWELLEYEEWGYDSIHHNAYYTGLFKRKIEDETID